MILNVRAEVTDGAGVRTSLEIECDAQVHGLRQIIVREFASFLDRTLREYVGRNPVNLRVRITNEEGTIASLEREGALYEETRGLWIQDASRFIEERFDDRCEPEQLYPCIRDAIKAVFDKKGYKLLKTRRSQDTEVALFRRLEKT